MKQINFLALLLVFSFALCQSVSAIGIIANSIVVENAIRGEEIQGTLKVFNSSKKESSFNLTAEGDVKDWASFYLPKDLDNPITQVTIASKAYSPEMVVVFKIPEDAPNEEYTGELVVISAPKEQDGEEGTNAAVLQKVTKKVSIAVTDNEIIDLRASVILKNHDLEKDESLRVRIIYDNQGNISMSPQVQFRIKKDEGGQSVYNVIHPYPENERLVKPLAIHEIPTIQIPTNGFEDGKYVVEVNFLYNGEVILKDNSSFTIKSSSEDNALNVKNAGIGATEIAIGIVALVLVLLVIKRKKK